MTRSVWVLLFVAVGLAGAACSSSDDGTTDAPEFTKGRKRSSGGDDDGTTSSREGQRSSEIPTNPSEVTDGGADAPPAQTGPVCAAIPTCANAKVLPGIRGDGAGTATAASGAGSQWLSVQVREDSFSGEPLGVTAYLRAPDGERLDLFLYDTNCTTVLHSSTGAAKNKAVWLDWQDVPLLDNSRTLLLEVRHIDGACDADHTWSMDVEGGSGI